MALHIRQPITPSQGFLTSNLSDYPAINLSVDAQQQSPHYLSASFAFLRQDVETEKDSILTAWNRNGIKGLLAALTELRGGKALEVVAAVSRFLTGAVQRYEQLAKEQVQILVDDRSVQRTLIRALAWHPHCTKLALATNSGTVLVYGTKVKDAAPIVLRHPQQRIIFCLAWRPRSGGYLAVGCEGGAAVWSIDPSSLGMRPSSSCFTKLCHEDQGSVTTLSWHPEGKLLCTGYASGRKILIWNVELEEAVPVGKFGDRGTSLVSWSPRGDRLLSASETSVFRVWDTRRWSSESWNSAEACLKTAAWSNDGRHVIFANSVQPILYGLTFDPLPALGEESFSSTGPSAKTASVVANLSELNFTDLSGAPTKIGGIVRNLVWDSKSERLAVVFQDSNVIAVFKTILAPVLHIVPCGVITGEADEIPSAMAFETQFKDGALLSIAWSSGRVQHVPFVFSSEVPHFL